MGNEVPAISVITIVKNNEELLPRAIDSVLGQSFTNLEHIIVNDGSTDDTKAIIDEYAEKDRRIKPKHMEQNVGRAMARNTGLGMVQGKYIFFLDSDDYLPETSLKDLYEVAEQDNADVVYGRIKSFDQSKDSWLPKHYTDHLITPERHGFRYEDRIGLLFDHSIIGRLYRWETLAANNIAFSTVRKNGEDVLFSFYTAFHAKRLSTIPEKIVYFYSVGNYMDTANEAKLFDARDNVLETLEFTINNGSDILIKAMRRKAAIFAANLDRVAKVYEDEKQKFIQYLETLPPFIDGITNDILNGLPPYYKRFANAVIMRDYDDAYEAWQQKSTPAAQSEGGELNAANSSKTTLQQHETQKKEVDAQIAVLQRKNKDLAQQLDRLYNTWSWRVTLPLRIIRRLLRRLKRMTQGGQRSA